MELNSPSSDVEVVHKGKKVFVIKTCIKATKLKLFV